MTEYPRLSGRVPHSYQNVGYNCYKDSPVYFLSPVYSYHVLQTWYKDTLDFDSQSCFTIVVDFASASRQYPGPSGPRIPFHGPQFSLEKAGK